MAMSLKRKIKEGKTVVGTMLCMITSPNIVYIIKNAGFDYIIMDCEHGGYTYQEISNIAGLCRALDLGIIVRIPQVERMCVQKYSDMGIDGIMIPYVEEAEVVEKCSGYARYKPYGTRGVSLGAIVDFKGADDLTAVLEDINENFIIMAQIESRKGVENIDKIMSVPGCDAVYFGVYDMSVSYDKPGEIKDPMFKDVIGSVLESAKKHGKILGHHFFSREDAQYWLEKGVQLACWQTDCSQLINTYKNDVEFIKNDPNYKK